MTEKERRKLYSEINKTKDYSLDDFEIYCYKCKETKHCSEFNKGRRNKNGYKDICRTCQNTLTPESAKRRKEYEERRSKDPVRKAYAIKKTKAHTAKLKEDPITNDERKRKNREMKRRRLEKEPQEKIKTTVSNSVRGAFRTYSKFGKVYKISEYGIDYNAIFEHIGPKPRKDYHLDHIIPVVAFDFDNPYHVYLCYHKENLRWLDPSENSSKNDKIVWSLYEGNSFLLAVAEVLGITKEMDGDVARNINQKDNI